MKILLLLGHPDKDSLNGAFLESFQKGATAAGNKVRTCLIGDLDFDPNLRHGYRQRMELEPDLLAAWEDIQWAEHIVFFSPVWWGSIPAVAKGFFDRLFLPGMAFKKREGSVWWDKLLKGRTAQLVFSLDQPAWYFRLTYARPAYHAVKQLTFKFVGIKVRRVTTLGPVRGAKPEKIAGWLRKMEKLGRKLS